nr:MAG: ORF1 [TTV-like mini virus]
MPYYNYYTRRRRRRRPLWRWRARGPFRYRRHWRNKNYYRYRRRTTVRKKRKLPYLRLKEWNPPYIQKLKCQGIIPLFLTTRERIVNNMSMYWYERTPHYVPGGGGFSIICFTLQAFYQLFQKCQCYWTRSNNTFPLIRFTGGTLKLYRAAKADYVSTYHSCYPMKPNLTTYNSCHPAILTLNKRHKIVTCKENNRNKKPYEKFKIKPPAPMQSKWFFQQEIAEQPLAMLMTSAASFDRMYLNSTSSTTTIGFKCLDPQTFNFHNWEKVQTSGYKANENKWLWALNNGTTTTLANEPMSSLIYLGDTKQMKPGDTIKSIQATSHPQTAWDNYMKSQTHWGNPFWPEYLNQEKTVLVSNKSPNELRALLTSSTWPALGANFTIPTEKLIQECRYNPYSDDGNNHIFLSKITDLTPEPWKQPTDPKLEGHNFPLWLSTFGFIDFMKNKIGVQVDTDYVVTIVSNHITPKLGFFIPIDEDFLQGRSKYQPDNTTPSQFDQTHWHPKVTMQLSSINSIGSSGPGTIKLPRDISAEAHCRFTFYFKLGGCGPEPNEIENPKTQPVFPTPNNMLQTTSLQSPGFPIEHFIYGFDTRRGNFTNTALERISKILQPKETLTSITDSNYLHGKITPEETSSEESQTEETETETLLQQLQLQRMEQHKLTKRILRLMKQK